MVQRADEHEDAGGQLDEQLVQLDLVCVADALAHAGLRARRRFRADDGRHRPVEPVVELPRALTP